MPPSGAGPHHWSKQYDDFDLDTWLEEHEAHPMLGDDWHARNAEWFHC